MGTLLKELSILRFFLLLILTIFFFSYVLIPNPEPTQAINGQYYGEYIWPVGVILYGTLGNLGWQLFNMGMSVWFIYSLPIFLIVQIIFGIQIPFSTDQKVIGGVEMSMTEWMIVAVCVVFYNLLLVKLTPLFIQVFMLLLKGVRYAELGSSVERETNRKGTLVGQEDQT